MIIKGWKYELIPATEVPKKILDSFFSTGDRYWESGEILWRDCGAVAIKMTRSDPLKDSYEGIVSKPMEGCWAKVMSSNNVTGCYLPDKYIGKRVRVTIEEVIQ